MISRKVFIISLFICSYIYADPVLTLVLMVKDERDVIEATLKTYCHKDVAIFVFDTGSTDGTQEKAREFFRENNVEYATLVEEPFIDFATSRNRGLDLAEAAFPNVPFLIMPDAEWYLNDIQSLVDFCHDHLNDTSTNSYLIRILTDALDFYTARLIRNHCNIRFVGVVHEVINNMTTTKIPETIYVKYAPSQVGNEKSARRWLRDRDLLLKSYYDNPYDPRTVFYLAQTYACLGDWKNACKYYQIRIQMPGWYEENFMAFYKLGEAFENRTKTEGPDMWHSALQYYLQAYAYRPQRAEPLIRIADYYLRKDCMPLCYLFAQRAAQIPYPSEDVLFVEKFMYDFTRYDILGRCSWYVNEFEAGEQALKTVLQKYKFPHLEHNLKFYVDRKRNLQIVATA